jgi:hypothetical protein
MRNIILWIEIKKIKAKQTLKLIRFLKYNKEKIIVDVSACPDGNPTHLILLLISESHL